MPIHSRVHRLKIGQRYNIPCYIKREDELGCVVSGTKLRKYQSLIPHILNKGCKKVALIGSSSSNNILGLASLLIENGIEPTLFLLESKEKPQGIGLFIQLFVPKKQIHTIPRTSWHEVNAIAGSWAKENNAYLVPEGAACPEVAEGLATLAYDILENEKEAGCIFNDILIDAGTGTTAQSLITTFRKLQKNARIHVLQLAPFTLQDQTNATIYTPTTAKSFGSTNSTIFKTITRTAQYEGVLLDPIYSAKLYLLLEKLLQDQALKGPVLFIHSGGLLSLAGFQHRLII